MNTKDIILSLVKIGDTVEIVPSSKMPNADRKFRVQDITKNGFIYGISENCDGYLMPFYAIEDIKIVK